MKKNALLLFMLLFFTISCKNDPLAILEETKPTEITCINGALYFPNIESFQSTVIGLSSGEISLQKFELEHGYVSLSSIIDWAIDEITEAENLTEREISLTQFQDIIEDLGEGVLIPKIKARGYTNIANSDGVYYVGDYKYTITPEKIIAEEVFGTTRSGNIIEGEYLFNTDYNTRATETRRDYSEQYKTSKRKVSFRLDLIRYWFVENGKIKNWFEVQTHMSAQKKSVFGWNSYKTEYYLDNFRFIFTLDTDPGVTPIWNKLESSSNLRNMESGREYKDWYYTWSFPQIQENRGNFYGWPFLHSLRGRFRSRGTGDCGGILPHSTGLSECKFSF